MTINDWRARYLALEQSHREAVELLREWEEATRGGGLLELLRAESAIYAWLRRLDI